MLLALFGCFLIIIYMSLCEVIVMGFFEKVFGCDTAHVHRRRDEVHVFGSVAGVVSIVSGIVLYVLLMPVSVVGYIRVVGLVWVLFGVLAFYGLYVFEYEDRRTGGRMLAILGLFGLFFGVGFFVGSLMMVFAGILGIRYSVRRLGEKLC